MANSKHLQNEVGVSGTSINFGRIDYEEPNYKLSGKQKLKVFDEMRRTDATVNAALTAIYLPIQQANYDVDPVTDDEADQEAADLAEHCLFEQVKWTKVLG